MYYFLTLGNMNHQCCGQKFKSIEAAIDNGTLSLVSFFEHQQNYTEFIFGQDIYDCYQNTFPTTPSFHVIHQPKQGNPYLCVTIELGHLEKSNSNDQDDIIHQTNHLLETISEEDIRFVSEEELFLSIAATYPMLMEVNCIKVFELLVPELYTNLLILAKRKKVNLKIDCPNCQKHYWANSLASLADRLLGNKDISETLQEIVDTLKTFAKEQWNLNVANILSNHLYYLKALKEPLV